MGKQLLHKWIQPVGHHQLFHQAPEDSLQPRGQILIPDGPDLPELLGRLAVAADGALHNLGEKADKQQQPQGIAVGGDGLPVYVHQIGDALQNEKGNTQGLQILRDRESGAEEGVHVHHEEAGILEHQNEGNVGRHRQPHDHPAISVVLLLNGLSVRLFRGFHRSVPLFLEGIHPQSAAPEHCHGREEIADEHAADQPVESQAQYQQGILFSLVRCQGKEEHRRGQKQPQVVQGEKGRKPGVRARVKQREHSHAQSS